MEKNDFKFIGTAVAVAIFVFGYFQTKSDAQSNDTAQTERMNRMSAYNQSQFKEIREDFNKQVGVLSEHVHDLYLLAVKHR